MAERNLIHAAVGIILIIFLAVLLGGCKSITYVPVETVRTDSIRTAVVERDSIYVSDSVFVLVKGDTVWKERIRTVYVGRTSTDTTYIERVDSIAVPYPVEVEKKLSVWEKIALYSGKLLLPVIGLCLIVLAVYLIIKKLF